MALLLKILVAVSFSLNAADSNTEKAQHLAQKLREEHLSTKAAPLPLEAVQDPFPEAHAKAMLSRHGLKKTHSSASSPRVWEPPPDVTDFQRSLASASESPWQTPNRFEAPASRKLSIVDIFFMALLGLFAGLAVAYVLFSRIPQKSFLQLMVPGSGEHFTIRPGSKEGEFILDIMDVRGRLVRTAGVLRPDSVARAAVLPPELAARLGAKGAFDRFEFTRERSFVPTQKEEGYQVFPFVT